MSRYNTAKIIKNSIYVIFVLIIISYAIYNSRIFIAGPQIMVSEPENGATVSESPLIRVKGTAESIAFIELNGKQINVNENSEFNEPVLLYPGYNIITIEARDKFERNIRRQIEVVFKGGEISNSANSEDPTTDENFATSTISTPKTLENDDSALETSTSSPTTSLEEI